MRRYTNTPVEVPTPHMDKHTCGITSCIFWFLLLLIINWKAYRKKRMIHQLVKGITRLVNMYMCVCVCVCVLADSPIYDIHMYIFAVSTGDTFTRISSFDGCNYDDISTNSYLSTYVAVYCGQSIKLVLFFSMIALNNYLY